MELECKCYRHYHAEDDIEIVREDCLIHGPDGTEDRKIAHLKNEHSRIKGLRQEKVDLLKKAIRGAVYAGSSRTGGGEPRPKIEDGIVAALLWMRDHNNGHIPHNPVETYERRELIRKYSIDPEEDNV